LYRAPNIQQNAHSQKIVRWHTHGRFNLHCPKILIPWLQDTGSLTASLIAQSNNQFHVKVLFQGFGKIREDERKALGLKPYQAAVVREVILFGKNRPWVFARSLLPLSSLTGRLRQLRKASSKPLGAFLFKQPNLKRSPIEIAKIDSHYLPTLIAQSAWGRRSVFYVDNKPLLVSEIFLSDFLETIKGN